MIAAACRQWCHGLKSGFAVDIANHCHGEKLVFQSCRICKHVLQVKHSETQAQPCGRFSLLADTTRVYHKYTESTLCADPVRTPPAAGIYHVVSVKLLPFMVLRQSRLFASKKASAQQVIMTFCIPDQLSPRQVMSLQDNPQTQTRKLYAHHYRDMLYLEMGSLHIPTAAGLDLWH